jgi:hypothetical protein
MAVAEDGRTALRHVAGDGRGVREAVEVDQEGGHPGVGLDRVEVARSLRTVQGLGDRLCDREAVREEAERVQQVTDPGQGIDGPAVVPAVPPLLGVSDLTRDRQRLAPARQRAKDASIGLQHGDSVLVVGAPDATDDLGDGTCDGQRLKVTPLRRQDFRLEAPRGQRRLALRARLAGEPLDRLLGVDKGRSGLAHLQQEPGQEHPIVLGCLGVLPEEGGDPSQPRLGHRRGLGQSPRLREGHHVLHITPVRLLVPTGHARRAGGARR